jgi:hypothetical protein
MGFDCRVCGLAVESSFELVGIPTASPAPAGDAVALELESPRRLASRWSGAATSGAWRGRLRDGAELTIRRGRAGDLMFAYGDGRATFLLDPAARRLGCGPDDVGVLDWQRVLVSRVLPLVAIARGAEALHAGAVTTERGAVGVLASSGGGKSTLVAELVGRGRALVSDDVMVLTTGATGVFVQPGGAHLSLAAAVQTGPGAIGEPLGVVGGKQWLEVEDVVVDEQPVAALVLLERGGGVAPRAEELPPSPLALAPFMLGLPDHEGRDAARFGLYSDLMATARLLRLSSAVEDPPAALADELERVLAAPVAASIEGAR